MPYSQYIDRVHALGEQIYQSKGILGIEFRSALCGLIADIPPHFESKARDLCHEVVCPPASELVEHLQYDLDTHADNPEHGVIFYPLIRVAISIRARELG